MIKVFFVFFVFDVASPFSFRELPSRSPFHDRSFFCHHTKKEPKKKSPSANPHSARPVVPEKCLPRIQAIFPSLPVGTTGLPLPPPWRTVMEKLPESLEGIF